MLVAVAPVDELVTSLNRERRAEGERYAGCSVLFNLLFTTGVSTAAACGETNGMSPSGSAARAALENNQMNMPAWAVAITAKVLFFDCLKMPPRSQPNHAPREADVRDVVVLRRIEQ